MVINDLKQEDWLSDLLFNIVHGMVIKKTNIITEVFTKREPQLTLAFEDDVDSFGGKYS